MLKRIALAACLIVVLSAAAVSGADKTSASPGDALADYLHHNRLPLVDVQLLQDSQGWRQVVLYGFVATPFGKDDAEEQARTFLDDPAVEIVNRIKIRPELLDLTHSSGSAPGTEAAESAVPPADSFGDESTRPSLDSIGDAKAYQEQQLADELEYQQQYLEAWNLPVLGLAPLMGGYGMVSSFRSFAPYYNSPFYNPPLYSRPYNSHPSPYVGPPPYRAPSIPYYGGTGFATPRLGPGFGYTGPGSGFGHRPLHTPHR